MQHLKSKMKKNNSRHLCFPFSTKALNDLLSFSIYLLHENNKEITFEDNEKKISILKFKMFLNNKQKIKSNKIKPPKLRRKKIIFY